MKIDYKNFDPSKVLKTVVNGKEFVIIPIDCDDKSHIKATKEIKKIFDNFENKRQKEDFKGAAKIFTKKRMKKFTGDNQKCIMREE